MKDINYRTIQSLVRKELLKEKRVENKNESRRGVLKSWRVLWIPTKAGRLRIK